MTKTERIAAYVNKEIERFKDGGDLVDEDECIAKVAFYLAVLRRGFPETEKYQLRVEVVMDVATAICEQMVGNAQLIRVRET